LASFLKGGALEGRLDGQDAGKALLAIEAGGARQFQEFPQ
jgi:hypothetical protein